MYWRRHFLFVLYQTWFTKAARKSRKEPRYTYLKPHTELFETSYSRDTKT